MWATCDFESRLQAPIECGLALANAFTAAATRRSELPSRNTGLTALPSTAAVLRARPGDRLLDALAGTGRLLALYGVVFAAAWTLG